MKSKKDEFTQIIEDTIYRFQSGGLMPGDIVKFRKNTMKHQGVSEMSQQYLGMIQNAMDTDLNLRVGSVKSTRPNTTGNYGGGMGGSTDAAADFYVDIVVEYAPGLWRDPITVPLEVLERIDTGINMAPIPDSLKKQTQSTKPAKIVTNDADRTNATTNTVLPTVAPQDGRDQIQSLEEAVEAMYESKFNKFILTFSIPYGAQPRDDGQTTGLLTHMIGLFGHNMMIDWLDDNTLELTTQKAATSKQVENAVAPIIDGTIEVEDISPIEKEMSAPGLGRFNVPNPRSSYGADFAPGREDELMGR